MGFTYPGSEEDFEVNDWQSYLRANRTKHAGHDSPFPGSAWSYASHNSVFLDDSEELKWSDETIHDDVAEAFYRSPDIDASDIEIHVLNGTVTLLGSIESNFSKLEASRLTLLQDGVWGVHNDIAIRS